MTSPDAPPGAVRLRLPKLGFGAASLGHLYAPVSDEEAGLVLEAVWDAGIRLYDTAPLYGGGLSEVRLGRGLARRPRADYVLCSKVGRCRPFGQPRAPDGAGDIADYSYDFALRSVAESLERLGTDRLDVVHIHDPDDRLDEAMRGAFRALVRLRDEGVVGAIGAGSNSAAALAELARRGRFDGFLVANRYTLLDQRALEVLLPRCFEMGIAVLAAGVFNSGILATGAGAAATYEYRAAPPEVQERVRGIGTVCLRHGVPVQAAALQFPLGHPAVTTLLLGGRSVAHLQENLQWLRCPIPEGLWSELSARGLLDPGAPWPVATETA
jgi:D-threo-aldose 1-dehydrogenase